MAEAERPKQVLYGRRHGPRLRPGRKQLLDTLLPQLALSADACGTPENFFKQPVKDVWLEVGFGGGEHLAAQAGAHPDIGFIGCEPFINGVARLLSLIEDNALDNVRIVPDDARPILEALPEASLGRIFVLFPDPWPKRRHHKRRFIAPDVIALLARALRPGGLLRLATDHSEYARWMLFHVRAHPDLAWTARQAKDWLTPPEDAIATRYQNKAVTQPVFLDFRRC